MQQRRVRPWRRLARRLARRLTRRRGRRRRGGLGGGVEGLHGCLHGCGGARRACGATRHRAERSTEHVGHCRVADAPQQRECEQRARASELVDRRLRDAAQHAVRGAEHVKGQERRVEVAQVADDRACAVPAQPHAVVVAGHRVYGTSEHHAHAAAVVGKAIDEQLARRERVPADVLDQERHVGGGEAVLLGVKVLLLPREGLGARCLGGHAPRKRRVVSRIVRELIERGRAQGAHELDARVRRVAEELAQVLHHHERQEARLGSTHVRHADATGEER